MGIIVSKPTCSVYCCYHVPNCPGQDKHCVVLYTFSKLYHKEETRLLDRDHTDRCQRTGVRGLGKNLEGIKQK